MDARGVTESWGPARISNALATVANLDLDALATFTFGKPQIDKVFFFILSNAL